MTTEREGPETKRAELVSLVVLDESALDDLRKRVGYDHGFLCELIDTFLGEAPSLLDDIRQAVARGSADAVRMAAHSLKPSAADFGATDLHRLCLEMEELGKAGSLQGIEEKLNMAVAELAKIASALTAVKDG